MKKQAIFIITILMALSGCKSVEQDNPPKDAFVNLKWNSDLCDNDVGFYGHEWVSDYLGQISREPLIFQSMFLEKDKNQIYFMARDGRDKNPEKDIGNIKYKIIRQQNNLIAVELEDKFLERYKKVDPDFAKHFYKYFAFEPLLRDLTYSKKELEYNNCELAVASCKDLEAVEALFKVAQKYLERTKKYDFVDYIGISVTAEDVPNCVTGQFGIYK